ncbi:hypothetical protein BU15DRAFT_68802 [Melanogaster broomeanus]|nr:hypothetical protein BU15DRAFT_68802 [Melanogaster broomeanus]
MAHATPGPSDDVLDALFHQIIHVDDHPVSPEQIMLLSPPASIHSIPGHEEVTMEVDQAQPQAIPQNTHTNPIPHHWDLMVAEAYVEVYNHSVRGPPAPVKISHSLALRAIRNTLLRLEYIDIVPLNENIILDGKNMNTSLDNERFCQRLTTIATHYGTGKVPLGSTIGWFGNPFIKGFLYAAIIHPGWLKVQHCHVTPDSLWTWDSLDEATIGVVSDALAMYNVCLRADILGGHDWPQFNGVCEMRMSAYSRERAVIYGYLQKLMAGHQLEGLTLCENTSSDDRVARQLANMARTKAGLVLPRNSRRTPEENTSKLCATLEKKILLLYALAEVQKDFENYRAQMIVDVGLDETKSLCDSYLPTNGHTAVGSFVLAVAAVVFTPYTIWTKALPSSHKLVSVAKNFMISLLSLDTRKNAVEARNACLGFLQEPSKPTSRKGNGSNLQSQRPPTPTPSRSFQIVIMILLMCKMCKPMFQWGNRLDNSFQNQEDEPVLQMEDDDLPLAQRRSRRLNRQLPLRFHDQLPESPFSLPPVGLREASHSPSTPSDTPEDMPPTSYVQSARSAIRRIFMTQWNKFGIFRLYRAQSLPTHDSRRSIWHGVFVCGTPAERRALKSPNGALINFWISSQAQSFAQTDVRSTSWRAIDRKLGSNAFDGAVRDKDQIDSDEGWFRKPITISVPFHNRCQHPGPKDYTLPDFHYRSLTSVIRETLADSTRSHLFHYEPYELRWHPPHRSRDLRVYGELFTADAFIQAHQTLQESPRSRALSSFGGAKLWPLYLYFGNHSKYQRCQPNHNLCTHVAYFQSLPDDFKDFAMEFSGKPLGDAFYTHCHRELFQAQWNMLLDDEFIEAYQHGIVITCCDGLKRRFYPRIFTYSADYPEKILVACIRNLGTCLCPRCLIPKDRVHALGTDSDSRDRQDLVRADSAGLRHKIINARRLIYDKNYAVDTAQVEALLKPESLVPVLASFSYISAFSNCLHHMGFDHFVMLVVDLLHEFELGVWKAVLIHLLRIVDLPKKSLLYEFDRR